jgi:hypothetical protein
MCLTQMVTAWHAVTFTQLLQPAADGLNGVLQGAQRLLVCLLHRNPMVVMMATVHEVCIL